MTVILRETNNYEIAQYVEAIQERFLIVALTDRDHARKYPLDHALELIDRIKQVTNGHRVFTYEVL